jgi:hypothetical protein
LVETYWAFAENLGLTNGPPEWRVLRPYYPTYWKELPLGYGVSIEYFGPNKQFGTLTDQEAAAMQDFMDHVPFTTSCYTNPFGDMFWPPGLERAAVRSIGKHYRERMRRTRPPKLPPTPLFPL